MLQRTLGLLRESIIGEVIRETVQCSNTDDTHTNKKCILKVLLEKVLVFNMTNY